MPWRVVVIDDEPLARLRLRSLLNQCGPEIIESILEWGDAGVALTALRAEDGTECAPQVVFLDVAMPGLSGLDLARELHAMRQPPSVVFVTAHAEHAVSAFDLDAVDYLTKPVRLERLQSCLARIAQRRSLVQGESASRSAGVLLCHERGALVRIPVESVLYCRAEHKHVVVRTPEREWLLDESLAELESRLGDRLVRVHRNALVTISAVARLERRDASESGLEGWALLIGPTQEWLAVSRRQLAWVKEKMAAL